MRVLPDVVVRRGARRLAVLGLFLAAATAVAGCSQFDAALGQRQAIVSFKDGTSVTQKLTVRSTCAKVANVQPQQLPADIDQHPYDLEQLTYEIDKASDANVAQLEQCLQKFPAVSGVTLQDSSDDGN
jgi:hypothetical protein